MATDSWSCFLIGEGTLLIQCAENLLRWGHEICGVISSAQSVRHWAAAKGIPAFEPDTNLFVLLERRAFDFLFSIANNSILPAAILKLPRRGAINFHPSPLPRYAGSHATSWALMNREPAYSVSWHRMSPRVNGGELLKEVPVEISPGETARTLNDKCDELGAVAFAELIDDLAAERFLGRPQDPRKRTFIARSRRPAAGCLLEWDGCAHDLDALVRALDFGPNLNPLGRPKLAVRCDFLIVPEITILDSTSQSPPGTIIGIDGNTLTVATASQDVTLRSLLTLEGEPITIGEVASKYSLKAGYRFNGLDVEVAAQVTRTCEAIARHEGFWVQRLASLDPIHPPCKRRAIGGIPSNGYSRLNLPIPREVRAFLNSFVSSEGATTPVEPLLAAFSMFLACAAQREVFDLGLNDCQSWVSCPGYENFFAPYLPLRLEIKTQQPFAQALAAARQQLDNVRSHQSYTRDVVARYPALWDANGRPKKPQIPIVIELAKTIEDCVSNAGSELLVVIPANDSKCLLMYDQDLFTFADISALARQFITFLRGLTATPSRPLREISLFSGSERRQALAQSPPVTKLMKFLEPPGARVALTPATTTEKALAQIWCELLGLERIGLEDDFFDSGGHSLMVTRVIARIRKAFCVEIPVHVLFEVSTIAGLSALIEKMLVDEIHELSEEEAQRFSAVLTPNPLVTPQPVSQLLPPRAR